MDKSGKRNRFLDALAGRNVQEEPEKFPEIPLKDMVQTLEGVTEEAWGRYAFAREPLERKFTSQEKDAYTVKANACGREWAKRISEKYGTEDRSEDSGRENGHESKDAESSDRRRGGFVCTVCTAR